MTATTTAAEYVAVHHNELNTTVLRITPQSEGMELVEYVGHLRTMERDGSNPEVVALVQQARDMATVTGAKQATHRVEGAGGALKASATWYRTPWVAPRRRMGLHLAPVTADPAQAELAARAIRQRNTTPRKGEAWVVSELSGYKLVQDRPYGHSECPCHNGRTAYTEGTVQSLTYWADNSVDVIVALPGGRTVTDQLVPPHGDACF